MINITKSHPYISVMVNERELFVLPNDALIRKKEYKLALFAVCLYSFYYKGENNLWNDIAYEIILKAKKL